MGTIAPVLKGNRKIGEEVLTESRPTHLTCPPDCPLWKTCYSHKLCSRGDRKGVTEGILGRFWSWRQNRSAWLSKRTAEFSRAASKDEILRLLVHGEMLRPEDKALDVAWINDISAAVSKSGIQAFGFTHVWRRLSGRILEKFRASGITMRASTHSKEEVRKAREKGMAVALVLDKRLPRMGGVPYRSVDVDGRPIVVCPHQTKARKTCDDCRLCLRPDVDVAFFKH